MGTFMLGYFLIAFVTYTVLAVVFSGKSINSDAPLAITWASLLCSMLGILLAKRRNGAFFSLVGLILLALLLFSFTNEMFFFLPVYILVLSQIVENNILVSLAFAMPCLYFIPDQVQGMLTETQDTFGLAPSTFHTGSYLYKIDVLSTGLLIGAAASSFKFLQGLT
jgi:hypothetical protein